MINSIGFWTPVRYEHPEKTFGQRFQQAVDSYFHLRGRVAVVVPGWMNGNSTGVELRETHESPLKTALKVVSYFTLVLPILLLAAKTVSRSLYPCHICQRTLRNGSRETGTFKNDQLHTGVRTKDGQREFIRPDLFMPYLPQPQEGPVVNFTWLITEDGSKTLIPIQQPSQPKQKNTDPENSIQSLLCSLFAPESPYTPYPGSVVEALFHIIQNLSVPNSENYSVQNGSLINTVLKACPEETRTTFLSYLLSSNEQGTTRILTINPTSLLEVLNLAREQSVTIDPTIVIALLERWAGTGRLPLIQALLQAAPNVLQNPGPSQEPSYFQRAALQGHEPQALAFWQAMQNQNVTPTTEDRWTYKALTDDASFTPEEWFALSSKLRSDLCKITNSCISLNFLRMVRELEPLLTPTPPERANLFSSDMDAVDVDNALRHFLTGLRGQDLLLTKAEFAQRDQRLFFRKESDISRILGRDYIERTAKTLGLDYIKVPKKTAVIDPSKHNRDPSSLQFRVRWNESMICHDLEIYAEAITPSDRKATQEEMLGLLNLIEKTCYWDFLGQNVFWGKNQAGEEGIYFIDTEYDAFGLIPSYRYTKNLRALMKQEDHEWLFAEIDKRFKAFYPTEQAAQELETQRLEEIEQQRPTAVQHGFIKREKPFSIPIADIIPEEAPRDAV